MATMMLKRWRPKQKTSRRPWEFDWWGGGGAIQEDGGPLWPASHNSPAYVNTLQNIKWLFPTSLAKKILNKNVPGLHWALASSVFSIRCSLSPTGPLEFDHSLSGNQPAPLFWAHTVSIKLWKFWVCLFFRRSWKTLATHITVFLHHQIWLNC